MVCVCLLNGLNVFYIYLSYAHTILLFSHDLIHSGWFVCEKGNGKKWVKECGECLDFQEFQPLAIHTKKRKHEPYKNDGILRFYRHYYHYQPNQTTTYKKPINLRTITAPIHYYSIKRVWRSHIVQGKCWGMHVKKLSSFFTFSIIRVIINMMWTKGLRKRDLNIKILFSLL